MSFEYYTRHQLVDVAQQLGLDNRVIVTVIEEIKRRRRELTANHTLTEKELRDAFKAKGAFFSEELADSILETVREIRENLSCTGFPGVHLRGLSFRHDVVWALVN